MDGWGAKWEKRLLLLIRYPVGEKRMIPVFAKIRKHGFTEEVNFFTTDLKKQKAEILKKHFCYDSDDEIIDLQVKKML